MRIFSFLHRRQAVLQHAVLLLGAAALASRVFGLLRDRIFAAQFGASDTLDVYFASFLIPDFIYNLLIAGAISAAFIPVFLELYQKNEAHAWKMSLNFLNIASVFLGVLAFVAFLVMPFIVNIIAPGFDGEKRELTVLFSRIMLLSPVLLGVSAVFSGINQSLRHFWPYALAPIFYNVGIIAGAVLFVPYFGITGLAWGVVLGALLHLAIQVPSVVASGFKFSPVFSPMHHEFLKMMRLLAPRTLGLAALQINLWAITAIASMLSAGSVAVFNLANNLQHLPIGIIGISFAIAVFPNFSSAASEHKSKELLATFSLVMRQIFFFVLPLAVLLFVLRAQIVRAVLGSGDFGWEATRLTAAVLGLFAFGVVAYSLIPTLARAFYALQDTITPVLITTFGILLNIILSVLFVFVLLKDGVAVALAGIFDVSDLTNLPLLGLPAAFSLSGIITALALFFVFFRRFKEANIREIFVSFARVAFVSFATGLFTFAALRFIPFVLPVSLDTFIGISIQGAVSGIFGLAFYVLIFLLFRLPEREFILNIKSALAHRPKNNSQF